MHEILNGLCFLFKDHIRILSHWEDKVGFPAATELAFPGGAVDCKNVQMDKTGHNKSAALNMHHLRSTGVEVLPEAQEQ